MNRYSFITSGAASAVSFSLLNAEKAKVSLPKGKAKSVIYLFMEGGISQFDSFNLTDVNPKLTAESKPIASSVTGVKVSHFFPKIAKCMNEVTAIHSLKSNQGAHPSAIYKMERSYNPRSSIVHPEIGAWVSKRLSKPEDSLPNYICINGQKSSSAGFFPGKYSGLPVLDPNQGIRFSKRNNAVAEETFKSRLSLLDQFNQQFDNEYGNRDTQSYRDAYIDSVKFMNSKHIDAFEIKKENESIKKLYSNDKFNQGCLLAARIIERGVKFVKVNLNGWDHHDSIYGKFPALAKSLDQGLSGLLEHLKQKGLFDSTLVVLATEFGRTPTLNVNKGRDHHPNGFTCLMAGAGIKQGHSIGKVSKDGKEAIEAAHKVEDFNATIAHAMDIPLSYEEKSLSGRPFKIANKGKVITDFFS